MACILTLLLFIGLCWAMVKFIYRDIPLEDDDGSPEVILPLVAYLVVVFGISVQTWPCVRNTGTFLNSVFPRQPLYGRYCAGDDAHRDLY